eukprot:6907829-Prymnesium_polylepis.1
MQGVAMYDALRSCSRLPEAEHGRQTGARHWVAQRNHVFTERLCIHIIRRTSGDLCADAGPVGTRRPAHTRQGRCGMGL